VAITAAILSGQGAVRDIENMTVAGLISANGAIVGSQRQTPSRDGERGVTLVEARGKSC